MKHLEFHRKKEIVKISCLLDLTQNYTFRGVIRAIALLADVSVENALEKLSANKVLFSLKIFNKYLLVFL